MIFVGFVCKGLQITMIHSGTAKIDSGCSFVRFWGISSWLVR